MMKNILPLICATLIGCSCPTLAQPAKPEPTTPAPPVQQMPLTQDDLMRLLGVQMWKWRLSLPATAQSVMFVLEDWRKGEKEPRLSMLSSFGLNPQVPPLASDFHNVLVRWPDSQIDFFTCILDGNGGGSIASEKEPFKGRSYSLRVNDGVHPYIKGVKMNEVKLGEPLVLVRAAYKGDNTYNGKEFEAGAEQRNDRTLSLQLLATDQEGALMPVWRDGKIVLLK